MFDIQGRRDQAMAPKLGHLNLKSMIKIIYKDAILGFPKLKIEEGKIYGECQIGKKTKISHKKLHHLTTSKVLELHHTSLMGLMQVESLGGKNMSLCVWMIFQGTLRSNLLKKNLTLLMSSKSYVNSFKEKKGV